MRYLLDINILSELIKPEPSSRLMTWMQAQTDDRLFISSLTLGELHKGILELPRGAKRERLDAWFNGDQGPEVLFRSRVLAFDVKAAHEWARLMALGKSSGRPRSALDMMVAATAVVHDCMLVTANTRHFPGMQVLNPL
jgi:predicted nucleic acid-binding protein